MANSRRSQYEIERDCTKIREAAKTATSFKELEDLTGLSNAMINTTLSRHPVIFKRIKEQLIVNQEIVRKTIEKEKQVREEETKQKTEKETEKSQAIAKAKIKSNINKESETHVSQKTVECAAQSTKDNNTFCGFVIDASITGAKDLRENLTKLCTTQAKIILTSITIKELEKLQKFKNIIGNDARYILNLAIENSNSFKIVLIDESFDTPDECIIEYCKEYKDSITLLTAKETMVLKAKLHNIQVHFFKKEPTSTEASKVIASESSNIRTLLPARRVANKLFLSTFKTNTMSIVVYSKGKKFNDGIAELEVGDDVFLSTKKADYITFAHYKMLNLYSENNCELIFSKRIYDYNDIELPQPEYEDFVEEFKHRFNL